MDSMLLFELTGLLDEKVYFDEHCNTFSPRRCLRFRMGGVQMTVLMATRNGEHVLPRTLGGYRRVSPPSLGWKLIVVDNGKIGRAHV